MKKSIKIFAVAFFVMAMFFSLSSNLTLTNTKVKARSRHCHAHEETCPLGDHRTTCLWDGEGNKCECGWESRSCDD